MLAFLLTFLISVQALKVKSHVAINDKSHEAIKAKSGEANKEKFGLGWVSGNTCEWNSCWAPEGYYQCCECAGVTSLSFMCD